jgi:integrase
MKAMNDLLIIKKFKKGGCTMTGRQRTKYRGVYERQSPEKIFKGKPDLCFDISYKHEGRKIWEKAGWLSEGYSAKLASDIRAEKVRNIRHGGFLPSKKIKAPHFKDVWAKYETWAETNKTRNGKDDKSLYQNHLKERFADKRLNEVTSFDIERLKAALQKSGLAPASVKHIIVLLRQIFNKAILWGLYRGGNPTKGVKMPTVQNQKTRFLSHEEADGLLQALAAMRTSDLHDMTLLSLHTGLRAGEIFNLKGNDLDFQNGIITILDPKNKVTRYAYMTGTIREMLLNRKPQTPEGLVFPDRNGKKIEAISQRFRLIVSKLGFNKGITDTRQKVTFHTLRHTHASWLALQGESLITIRDILGHKTTAMTERYSHLIADHKRRAAVTLEEGFKNGNYKKGELAHE